MKKIFNKDNPKIIKKFDYALKIIANYYNFNIKECSFGYNYINHIDLKIVDIHKINSIERYNTCIKILTKQKLYYVIPFFKIWITDVNPEFINLVNKNTFQRINKILKSIKNNVI